MKRAVIFIILAVLTIGIGVDVVVRYGLRRKPIGPAAPVIKAVDDMMHTGVGPKWVWYHVGGGPVLTNGSGPNGEITAKEQEEMLQLLAQEQAQERLKLEGKINEITVTNTTDSHP